MRYLIAAILTAAFATSAALAQNVAAPVATAIHDGSTGYDVLIPNYGWHGFVRLTMHHVEAAEARDLALPVFTALVAAREGTMSVTIQARPDFGVDRYTLTLQRLEGDDVRVYLDGEPFDP